MGFIDTTTDPKTPIFYNVIHAVGRDCPNQRDDVKLVQFLLREVYKNPNAKAPQGEMKVDGICGPTTLNWILKFQLNVLYEDKSIIVDGRVDRVRNNSAAGSISQKLYTLLWLNFTLSIQDPATFATLGTFIPLTPVGNVPPPSIDFSPAPQVIPATGGI